MAQQDQVEKLLEEHEDVFADIFNVLLFKNEIINVNELLDTKVKSQYKADDGTLHEIERDVSKKWKDKVTFAVLGIENQTTIDKFMPLRILAYDGANYRSQLLKKEGKEIYPVITIVLYFGKDTWNQPTTLKETLKKHRDIPKELEPYVNDYTIYVFDIPRLKKEIVQAFKSDFRFIADYFVQKKIGETYIPLDKDTNICHVDETLKFLYVFSGAEQFKQLVESGKSKEVFTMGDVVVKLDDMEKEKQREAGKIESTVENLKHLMVFLNWNLHQAMDALGLKENEREKYIMLIEKK